MSNTANNAEPTVIHAYGIVPGDVLLPEIRGLGGAAVGAMPLGDMAVLISRLRRYEYGAEVWQSHAEDPRWLGDVAAEHHLVLQTVLESADVLPLRLPTLHSDEAALEDALSGNIEQIITSLTRIRGCVELGAKAYLVAKSRSDDLKQASMNGREYLARRKAQADLRESARTRRHHEVIRAHVAMAAAADDATTNRPQDPALSGRPEPMVLNSAYLLHRDSIERFVEVAEEAAEELHSDGIELEITGPWPPYNFVTEDVTCDDIEGGRR
ncbi:MAG TPA: GvpL/GvpF family gas vesicle protein [Microlunatus sp.]